MTLTSDPARTGIANQRPNLVLDNPYGDKSYTNYLNRAAFAEPALGTLGNLQRNGIVGPGTRSWTCRWCGCSGSAATDRGARRGLQRVQLVQPVANTR